MLGHYRIIGHMAEGGMGHIYKAFEEGLQREVAVKVLKAELAENPTQLKMFLQEAQKIATLRHPNIMPVYYVGQQEGLYFFVMPFIEGSTLDDWVEAGEAMTVEQGEWALSQAIDALDWAFQHQIIHLDIKPSNFMIDPSGVILLTDFGLAQSMAPDEQQEVEECYGTPAYIAPEQILKKPTDQRSDIYSLGAALYHLMTMNFLHDGESIDDIIIGHLESPFPYEYAESMGLRPGWINLFDRMTQKDPDDRFQDYSELRDAAINVDKLAPVKPTEVKRAGNKIPVPNRSGASKEHLYGLLRETFSNWSHTSVDTGLSRTRGEMIQQIDSPMKPLLVSELVPSLKELRASSSDDVAELAETIGLMPEIETYIMALANTSFCDHEGEIKTRRKAVRAVGPGLTQSLILTSLMLEEKYKPGDGFNWAPLFHHSITVGVVATFLCDFIAGKLTDDAKKRRTGLVDFFGGKRSLSRARNQAFFHGFIHDIGKLIMSEVVVYPYYIICKTALEEGNHLQEYELEQLNITHSEAGAHYLNHHGFDGITRDVVLNHHSLDQSLSIDAGLVAIANQVVKRHGIGYSANPVVDTANLWETEAWKSLLGHYKSGELSADVMETEFVPVVGEIPLMEFRVGGAS